MDKTFIDLANLNYIAGEWKSSCKETHSVFQKYTGQLMAECPLANESMVENALTMAERAQNDFSELSAGERADALSKLYLQISNHKQNFAELIAHEAGKPISYAHTEVERALSTLQACVSEATQQCGENVALDFGAGRGKMAFTQRFPIGPILCITPFNFPLNLAIHKIGPALASGCPVIIKAPPQTPLSISLLSQLIDRIGLPKGAYQSLFCSIEMAEKMVTDERIKMVSFTGSDRVGWHIKSIAGKKKVTLELGGNAAVIVDRDTEITSAAKAIANSAYLYAGQICISTQRIYVHEEILKTFTEQLLEQIEGLTVGDPLEESTVIGPIIDSEHCQRIMDWTEQALAQGAKALIKGAKISEDKNLLGPTLLTNTNQKMKVSREEVFGPVATLDSFHSIDEAINKVNDSRYGLQAGVYTNNIEHLKQAYKKLQVGGVIANSPPAFRVDTMPYGGIKDSGLGREGVRYAMEEMTEPRLLVF